MVTLLQIKKYFQKAGFWESTDFIKQIKESNNNKIFEHNAMILKKYTHKKNYIFEKQCLQILSKKNKKYFPKVLFDDPKNYVLIFNKLPWETLDKIRLQLPAKQQSMHISQLINFLQELRNIPAPKWYSFEKYLKNEVKKYYNKAKENPYMQKENIKKLYEYIIKNLHIFSQQKSILIYSDFWVKNILADKKTITGIIDFETWCYAPLCIEWYKILYTLFSIKNWWDDTSAAEQDFMKKFFQISKKKYPELFLSNPEQSKIYHGVEYIKKLSRYKQKRYSHKEVENFHKEFL